jgi:uncharacterized membrane protein YeaQ/YmgE (transglycosylase-associated protein family)
MSVLGYILFGFVVGLLARAVMPGRDPLGLIGTTILGIIGALAAGWTGRAFGLYAPDDGAGFVSATLGAVVVLAIYHLATRRSRSTLRVEDSGRPASPSDRPEDARWKDVA